MMMVYNRILTESSTLNGLLWILHSPPQKNIAIFDTNTISNNPTKKNVRLVERGITNIEIVLWDLHHQKLAKYEPHIKWFGV